MKAVKERELPPIDDAFAKLASEFENLTELKADLTTRLTRLKQLEQGAQARDLLVAKLTSGIDIPLPAEIIEEEVNTHLEKEGRLDDQKHRAEVTDEVKTSISREFLLDTIVKAESVAVNESELTEYLVRAASRYGMTPDQFIKEVSQAGQISTMVAEVARAKALAQVLSRVQVVDKSGKKVDLEALAPKSEPRVRSRAIDLLETNNEFLEAAWSNLAWIESYDNKTPIELSKTLKKGGYVDLDTVKQRAKELGFGIKTLNIYQSDLDDAELDFLSEIRSFNNQYEKAISQIR